MNLTVATAPATQERVVQAALGNGDLFGMRTATPGLFTLSGSFHCYAADSRAASLPSLVAVLTTCGTRQRDAVELARVLEGCGIALAMTYEAPRVRFSARACSEDLALVIEVLAQCLQEPTFDTESMDIERARLSAELQYRAVDPRSVASDALCGLLYPAGDPRHVADVAAQLVQLEGFTRDDVRQYHRDYFRANDLHIVVVGDIDPLATAALIDGQLGRWPVATTHDPQGPHASLAPTSNHPAATTHIRRPELATFGIAMGHAIPLRCDHPDYMAVWLANQILGGSFTSRLVSEVREQQGLTYSIRSDLSRASRAMESQWQILLSLSPDQFDAGLDATRSAIDRFVVGGVSEKELAARQREAIGAFQIGLATQGGLADALLLGAETGWGAGHLSGFATKIGAVTADELNRCIRQYLQPENLHLAVAGPSEVGYPAEARR